MKRTLLLPAILLLCFQACVTLDQVHSFSRSACNVLSSVNDLDYSFKGSYLKYTLPGKKWDLSLKDVKPDTADLHLFEQADATVALFANSLIVYFSGLGAISDPAVGASDYSKLGDALKGNDKVMAKLHITADQVEAGVSLAHLITNTLTKHYQEQKIREIMLNDTAAVRKTIEALGACLGELQNTVVSDREQIRSKYFLITADTTIDKGVRINFAREYWQEASKLEETHHAIGSQRQGLESLKKAHRDIAEKLKDNKLSAKEILPLIEQYAAELQTIYNDIKKLSK